MPRYRKLGYVALNVTDVERSKTFYEDAVGLEFSGMGEDGAASFRCSTDHHNIVLHPSARPGLKSVGWEMETDTELASFVSELTAAGVALTPVPERESQARGQGLTYRLAVPHIGVSFEFYSAMQEFANAFRPTLAKIQRLGHVVLRTPYLPESVAFLRERLNFRISDAIGDRAAFLRCFPNPYHHTLAIVAGTANTLHHVNLMVSEIDDVGRAIARFKRKGIPIVHGPGRHPPSESVFLYFLDPDGLTLEYSFGMEEFPEFGARKHRILEPVQLSYDYWGCEVDPRKAAIGEIEADVGSPGFVATTAGAGRGA